MKNKIALLLLAILTSCSAYSPSNMRLTKVDFEDLSGWSQDSANQDYELSLAAFLQSCAKFGQLPRNFNLGKIAGKVSRWLPVCAQAGAISPKYAKRFFEGNFIPYLVSDSGDETGLFTGYYEAEMNGSLTKKHPYIYPVYRKPADKSLASLSRQRIENGALSGKNLEIAYVDDPVALFFLHIQGSGLIRLNNGGVMKVGYAAQNGHGYTSLGRYLADEGVFELEEVTAQKIKKYLHDDLTRAKRVMDKNASYIFFRKLQTKNPIGGQGVELTAGYSLAIDKRYIPYGAPLWIETTTPSEGGVKDFKRLMIAQDTGGAIKGIVRADIFFGSGKRAEDIAGLLKQDGKYYILLPK